MAVPVAMAACSGGNQSSAPSDHPRPVTTQPTATTVVGSTTTRPATSAPPPTTAAGAGFFDESQVEDYVGHVSASYQGDPPPFSFNKSIGGVVATTADGVCTFTLTNTLGESASLVDAIAISCGSPNRSSALTQSDSVEAAAYLDGIVQQFAGPSAVNWVNQQATGGATHGSAVAAHQSFGKVTIGVEFGEGELFEKLETTG
jgi:hypothetical protein